MRRQLITNIGCLANVRTETTLLRGKALAELPIINDAFLYIEDGVIKDYGTMPQLETGSLHPVTENLQNINANGATVLPCWCDSHTHLVFAASREEEFVDKLKGKSYAEIAAKGGGILNSARKLNAASEEELYEKAFHRLHELIKLGTGAIEIKSGYGLTVEGELKMLRVIKRLKEKSIIPIKATFLGAHAYPEKYKEDHDGYIKLIIDEMLPNIAKEQLADYIDVFCEDGFFSVKDTVHICEAGAKYSLKPKLHVNQLNSIGGIEAGIQLGAVSLDHLETLTDDEIVMLSGSKATPSGEVWKGISTLLPTAAFFLRMEYQPARQLIDAGCAISLASDFNPGSSPGGNMNFVVSLSCIQMKMLPEEAINAATLNGAYAMELGHELGSITPGKKANLIFTKPVPSVAYLPYAFSSNLIDKVMIGGEFV
ncbi:MAG: imidazolonepropionase [Panacibacter sp.]